MSDAQVYIDALLLTLDSNFGNRQNYDNWEAIIHAAECTRYHAALTALIAERDALRKRVAELEAQPTSDERARLCAEVSATRTAITRSRRSLRDASESCEELERMIKEGGGA